MGVGVSRYFFRFRYEESEVYWVGRKGLVSERSIGVYGDRGLVFWIVNLVRNRDLYYFGLVGF